MGFYRDAESFGASDVGIEVSDLCWVLGLGADGLGFG